MILRKPYAFFIKMFKPIHLILAILVTYLIYLNNKVLNFLSTYIYSSSDVTAGENIRASLINNLLFIIPMIVILFSIIILIVMFRKKKAVTFYVVSTIAFTVIIIINSYASNFLGTIEHEIVSITSVKLIHDLILINIGIESIFFILFAIRGLGLNFKKFDFSSDLSKMDINESDQEEFELDFNIDLTESKRKRKRKLRYLKYAYIEHKFLINCILIVVVCVLALIIYGTTTIYNKKNSEGIIYSAGSFNFGVNQTYILNTDYRGNKLTDNYLIVVSVNLQSYSANPLFLNDFSLKIGEAKFKSMTKYSSSLMDLGIVYNENNLSSDISTYLFIYEIPEKYTTSEMLFSYNNQGESIDIKLNPKKPIQKDKYVSADVNHEISFIDTLGDIKFNVSNYEIKDKFEVNYKYCVNSNDCINSKEYLKPSIDSNFDKYVLKLGVQYNNNSVLNLKTFYDFFSQFGSIYYNIDGIIYHQDIDFEEIKSNKTDDKNIYIGINSEISRANSIILTFEIRGSKYEYILK